MPNPAYIVTWSAAAVKALKAQAKQSPIALRRKISAALEIIDARLRIDPTGFGEVYRSRGNIEHYLGAHAPITIDFGVDTTRKLVYVRSCHVLSGPG